MSSPKLVWFITGANAGLGLAIAKHALSNGHTVVATARTLSKFPQSLKDEPNADLIEIEINAPAANITAAVDQAVRRHGQIDVLVNNAGFGMAGAVEQVTEADARYQFDINFFGLFNFTKAAIPHMRARKSGVIVQISSSITFLPMKGAPLYAASKGAVELLTEGLYNELQDLGIRVHAVEPGYLRTSFLADAAEGKISLPPIEGYIDLAGMMAGSHGKQTGDPAKAAQCLFELATGTGVCGAMQSELRIVLGSDALGMLEGKINSLNETVKRMRNIAPSIDF
ncbi:NAD(P)-binding protein, partial [Thozetella sp. PMI_491]